MLLNTPNCFIQYFSITAAGAGNGAACPQVCTMEYKPVCDSQGNTHGNKCAFEIAACEAKKRNENLVITKEGACDSKWISLAIRHYAGINQF